jgi:hypothetical protein
MRKTYPRILKSLFNALLADLTTLTVCKSSILLCAKTKKKRIVYSFGCYSLMEQLMMTIPASIKHISLRSRNEGKTETTTISVVSFDEL